MNCWNEFGFGVGFIQSHWRY